MILKVLTNLETLRKH